MKRYNHELVEPYRKQVRARQRAEGQLKTPLCGIGDEDYEIITSYIIENKPKLIVEYGSGESTYYINNLLDELGYGGRIVSFEDTELYYNVIKDYGWDEKNSVNLVPIELGVVDDWTGARYLHSYEGLEEVDYVIIDGPDIGKLDVNTTFNLLDMWQKFDRFIPYFIDGREGTKRFYQQQLQKANFTHGTYLL